MKNHWLDQINNKRKLKERNAKYEKQIIHILKQVIKPKDKKHGS